MSKVYEIYSEYEKDTKLVGKIHCNKEDKMYIEEFVPLDYNYFPVDLLGIYRDWERDNQANIIRWLESRVIPRNRQFLREILDMYRIPEWDLDTLLKLNHGRVTDDKFYVEIGEE
jgi:hypothetical protein